ncbi:hypothetical protein Mal4_38400 [Maioricimonas rarisocia]|uniref:Uncharacterized protein n=1 Tax=Maioricimonas rarisocia TaxID=2528026 RepID=A0A517ZAH7_9PLAN|nr:hypothetical protein [Maioricimonas rarisocia]QDU39495.1 hypothetical protein Mal4_38400 [Maioricimonas rarisocia]
MNTIENLFEMRLLRKWSLYVLIASVSISALAGIAAILTGDFGLYEVRILLTSGVIASASLCSICCGTALETHRRPLLPVCGLILTFVSAAMIIAGIWIEVDSGDYWKTAVTLAAFGVSCSHVALLTLARPAGPYRWIVPAAGVAVFAVASIFAAALWGDFDIEPLMRALGVAAILDGALTILVPVLHRLSRSSGQTAAREDLPTMV